MAGGAQVIETMYHAVRFVTPAGEFSVEVPEDECLLEAAEGAGVELPRECGAGACTACTGRLLSGAVDQSEGVALDQDEVEAGFVLLCVAYARGPCAILTHRERELHEG
jgi:ferredoxin